MNIKDHYDIAIVGAGIVGSAIAYKLSVYDARVILIDKASDVGCGATKANSGIIHGGYAAKHGSTKAELSIAGNRQYDELSARLGFPFSRCGSYVLAFDDEEEQTLEAIRENGRLNGVYGLEIIRGTDLKAKEPRVNDEVLSALYCPGAGIVSPYEAAIAMAEQAAAGGTDILLRTEVTAAEPVEDGWELHSTRGTIRSSAVIDAAGLGSGDLARLLGEKGVEISARKGQYLVLQRGSSSGLGSVMFQTPTPVSKGILVTPTTWGNIMIGPNAEESDGEFDLDTDFLTLKNILDIGRKSVPDLDAKKIIRSFSGLRASSSQRDFIIRRGQGDGVYLAAGIESPGLTSAPAIADMMVDMLAADGRIKSPQKNRRKRKPIAMPGDLMSFSKIQDDVKREEGDPRRIVCRCEQVRESVIRDALSRPIPIDSMDAVKRRTRAGMGGCQGHFCGSRVRSILESHLSGKTPEPARKNDGEFIKSLREL